MTSMTNKQNGVALAPEVHCLVVDFRDERAGCVERVQLALLRLESDLRRNSVRTEDDPATGRHAREVVDEDRSLRFQLVYDVTVVDDLLADVDRSAVANERKLDDVDCARDASTETPRVDDDYLLLSFHADKCGPPGHKPNI